MMMLMMNYRDLNRKVGLVVFWVLQVCDRICSGQLSVVASEKVANLLMRWEVLGMEAPEEVA